MAHRFCRCPVIVFLAAAAAMILALPAVAQDSPPEVQKLRSLIGKATDLSDAFDEIPRAAIDAGPAAIPMLRKILLHGKGPQGELAAFSLAYIGGEPAVDLLRQRFQATQDRNVKTTLAMAMASTRLTADGRAFLENSLEGEQFGDQWMPIVSAALSLGVLRSTSSVEALEKASKEDSIASHAAREALRWMALDHWEIEASSKAKIGPLLAAVLRNGVPRTDEAERFFDRDRRLVWIRENVVWKVQEADSGGDLPLLSFHVHTSPDGRRALVSVGTTFGPLNGTGYDYVLRKEGAEWVVQGVFFTWIS
ncbi:MAG: HEAT repeat domain-containing protein [Thermoanaerobaculia bacterium]